MEAIGETSQVDYGGKVRTAGQAISQQCVDGGILREVRASVAAKQNAQ
jgi:hypothetical protein